jgi:DNA-binding CsgD family transcriptional regulator
VLGTRALAEAHGDRPREALRTVARLDSLAPEPYIDVAADLAYVLARAGGAISDESALAAGRRRIAELARVAAGPGVIGAAEAVRGLSASSEGRREGAVRHFQSAAEQFERAPRWILAAEAWCDAAQAAGRGAVATAALERAQRVCDELGLVRVAGRVAAVRDRLAGEPAPLPPELAELTPREREVVLLAADGLSNREIGARLYLSDGTVRNYLSTAFGKLGVTRRAELGRLVAAAGSFRGRAWRAAAPGRSADAHCARPRRVVPRTRIARGRARAADTVDVRLGRCAAEPCARSQDPCHMNK